MKTVIKAEIVAHSINEQGDELISVMATFSYRQQQRAHKSLQWQNLLPSKSLQHTTAIPAHNRDASFHLKYHKP